MLVLFGTIWSPQVHNASMCGCVLNLFPYGDQIRVWDKNSGPRKGNNTEAHTEVSR